jgi:hypothetical protein
MWVLENSSDIGVEVPYCLLFIADIIFKSIADAAKRRLNPGIRKCSLFPSNTRLNSNQSRNVAGPVHLSLPLTKH